MDNLGIFCSTFPKSGFAPLFPKVDLLVPSRRETLIGIMIVIIYAVDAVG